MKIRLQTVRVTSFRLTDPGSNVDGLKNVICYTTAAELKECINSLQSYNLLSLGVY